MTQKVKTMSLEEKVGQKLMLDFRYWDPSDNGKSDMIAPDDKVEALITDNHIGGVILFANNLKDRQQIKTLTEWYSAMKTRNNIRLFIDTDNVFRLPRGVYASSYYGFDNGIWRRRSMDLLAKVFAGKLTPQGKLPVNIWHEHDANTNTGTVAYLQGFGLTW